MPKLLPPLCPKCGKPQVNGVVCATCRQRQTKIDGIRSPFRFEGTMRQAIHQLKYRNLKAISSSLAVLLADYLLLNPLPGEVLVPVPLHPRRLRERGYNQSVLLAKELSRLINLPVITDCLIRVKEAKPQVRTTTVKERRENVTGAFICHGDKINGKQIILVDDVCTSGATLEACTTALKNNGAVSIWGLTIAMEILE
ncbi:MAG: amidophosphoribosyltransferase [Chloroflexi bacterium CG_4_10_14_0_8_um_filter_46_9]|nr:MAG: amidophosphoribosyltransferase [Chloroflexi bacterium CG15_BIG_FIL_POST_REV_8_21_14_020_46_15]PIZ26742.1 MAG: amidophosphoribosyltransferase [Chloroflexi bacterium CG_4_10_14_0_8_um_filter_46_9]